MKRINTLLGTLLLASLMTTRAQTQTATTPDAAELDRARTALASQAPLFVENHGQWNPQARYLARFKGLDLWVTDHSIVYDLYRTGRDPGVRNAARPLDGLTRSGHVLRMNFIGASASEARVTASGPAGGSYNYFFGKDRSRWGTNLRGYSRATIEHLYKGIDAVLYVDGGKPRYDLVVAPGADPSAIRVSYEGAQRMSVDRSGSLVLGTSVGDVKQQELFAYQTVNGVRRQVRCAFKVRGDGTVGFALGRYDAARPLVIDPLVFSTFLGGVAWDEARGIAVDANGAIYVAGFSLSIDFPVRPGSYRIDYLGSNTNTPPGGDVFVSKIDPTSPTPLAYSTFIGGYDDDVACDIAVDNQGSAYVTGTSFAGSFPTTDTLRTPNGQGTFVAKVAPNGNALLYNTFVADGALPQEGGIAVDRNHQAYIAGTTSANTLYSSIGAFLTNQQGPSDAFVVVMDSTASSIRYATYLGGSGSETATGIALDNNGAIVVVGRTSSSNFPLRGALDSSYNGAGDIFLARLDTSKTGVAQLTYGTYIGGGGYESAGGITISRGRIYLAGTTTSGNFPTRRPYQSINRGNNLFGLAGDAFILRLDPEAVPSQQLGFSTFLGSDGPDEAKGIAVDGSGNVYVAGWTGSATFPITRNAIDTLFSGDSTDAFITKLNDSGRVVYSTFLGGSDEDQANDIAVDSSGAIYVAGFTQSSDFMVTEGAAQKTFGSGSTDADAFVTMMRILEILTPNGGEAICAGGLNTINWTGGNSVHYDIFQSPDDGVTYNPIALNIDGNSYVWSTPVLFPAGSHYRLKVVAIGAESDASDASFTINTPPIFTNNPVDVSQPAGASATFRVDFTGSPTPTVQWETNTGNGWTPINGATATSLTISGVTISQNGTLYRAVVKNSCATVTSTQAKLTVVGVAVIGPNGGEQFCAGTTQKITWSASATSGPYDLYALSDGGSSPLTIATGVTGNSYDWTIPAGTSGNGFRVYVRLSGGQTQDRSDQTFSINREATIASQPQDAVAERGANAQFTVSASAIPTATVQWEQSSDGTTWTPIPGATGNVLTVPAVTTSMNGWHYRAVLTNACGTVTSNAAMLTVTTGSGVEEDNGVNGGLRLSVGPNPAGDIAEIRFTLPRSGVAHITIADAAGRVVGRPVDAAMSAGDHSVSFNAASLPNGAYFVELALGGARRSVKVTVAR
jgi:hypothetical protein